MWVLYCILLGIMIGIGLSMFVLGYELSKGNIQIFHSAKECYLWMKAQMIKR